MKKLLLCMTLACLGLAANAQILSESFSGAAVPAMPTGWSAVKTGSVTAQGWVSTASTTNLYFGTVSNSGVHAKYAVVNEYALPGNYSATMTSPVFSLAGTTNAYLGYDYVYFQAFLNTAPYPHEIAWIEFTTDGSIWTLLDSISAAGTSAWSTKYIPIPSTSSTTCQVRFQYADQMGKIIGIAIDEIKVVDLTTPAGAVTGIDYNSAKNGISNNGEPVTFTVQNTGITLTSFDAYYTINGGGAVSQTFTPTTPMAPYTIQTFSFTPTISGAVAGSNTLRVGIPTVNTVANTELVDSARNSTFVKASASVPRNGLIEEFSSSTCAPCKSFNQSYDPLTVTLNFNAVATGINIIKYQMDWPSPNNDRSYNSEGAARQSYYGVNSIPDHFVNGQPGIAYGLPLSSTDLTNLTNEGNASKANKAFMDITVTYNVDTFRKKLGTIVSVTPHFTKTGGYHVYVACMDKYYENTTNTTGQLKYYHVMRKMWPNATGYPVTSWTDGTAQTFVDSGKAYTNGNWSAGSSTYPTQGDNKFWSSPVFGEVVVFVEEDATKSVMQSLVSFPVGTVSVSTLSKVDAISLYPNPTSSEATLKFNMQEAGNVKVSIVDISGRILNDVYDQNISSGMQTVKVSTGNLPAGEYIVLIQTQGGNNVIRMSVAK